MVWYKLNIEKTLDITHAFCRGKNNEKTWFNQSRLLYELIYKLPHIPNNEFNSPSFIWIYFLDQLKTMDYFLALDTFKSISRQRKLPLAARALLCPELNRCSSSPMSSATISPDTSGSGTLSLTRAQTGSSSSSSITMCLRNLLSFSRWDWWSLEESRLALLVWDWRRVPCGLALRGVDSISSFLPRFAFKIRAFLGEGTKGQVFASEFAAAQKAFCVVRWLLSFFPSYRLLD